nr:hypothetical protein GCM10010200_037790 [Actinomadura rugatobispora]
MRQDRLWAEFPLRTGDNERARDRLRYLAGGCGVTVLVAVMLVVGAAMLARVRDGVRGRAAAPVHREASRDVVTPGPRSMPDRAAVDRQRAGSAFLQAGHGFDRR